MGLRQPFDRDMPDDPYRRPPYGLRFGASERPQREACALIVPQADTMVPGAEQMSASAETPSVLQHRTAVRLRALTGRMPRPRCNQALGRARFV
ncbi:hypothetical protein RN2511_009270 [Rhodococcus sp. NKCM2511]|nr:hypothetical protein RN2511_009270 [Rhodococcus sp. NKCM2511]